jgi:hypothetical protein
MRTSVPSVYDWVRRLEDSSGIEGEWHSIAERRTAVDDMLRFCATYYLPFLQANAEAYAKAENQVSLSLAGQPYSQPPFKYQVKCYSRLKTLLADAKAPGLREVLAHTCCLAYLE